MIYYDLLLALKGEVAKAVDELFGAAYANQTHSQDLLLIDQHGSYSEMLADSRVRGAHVRERGAPCVRASTNAKRPRLPDGKRGRVFAAVAS